MAVFISKFEIATIEGERLFYVRLSDSKKGVADLHGSRWPSTVSELMLVEDECMILVLHSWDTYRPAWQRGGYEAMAAAAGD